MLPPILNFQSLTSKFKLFLKPSLTLYQRDICRQEDLKKQKIILFLFTPSRSGKKTKQWPLPQTTSDAADRGAKNTEPSYLLIPHYFNKLFIFLLQRNPVRNLKKKKKKVPRSHVAFENAIEHPTQVIAWNKRFSSPKKKKILARHEAKFAWQLLPSTAKITDETKVAFFPNAYTPIGIHMQLQPSRRSNPLFFRFLAVWRVCLFFVF